MLGDAVFAVRFYTKIKYFISYKHQYINILRNMCAVLL